MAKKPPEYRDLSKKEIKNLPWNTQEYRDAQFTMRQPLGEGRTTSAQQQEAAKTIAAAEQAMFERRAKIDRMNRRDAREERQEDRRTPDDGELKPVVVTPPVPQVHQLPPGVIRPQVHQVPVTNVEPMPAVRPPVVLPPAGIPTAVAPRAHTVVGIAARPPVTLPTLMPSKSMSTEKLGFGQRPTMGRKPGDQMGMIYGKRPTSFDDDGGGF